MLRFLALSIALAVIGYLFGTSLAGYAHPLFIIAGAGGLGALLGLAVQELDLMWRDLPTQAVDSY